MKAVILAILLALLLPAVALAADPPLNDPARWDVVSAYTVIEGVAEAVDADLNPVNGTYWMIIRTDDGQRYWAKFYPGLSQQQSWGTPKYSRVAVAGPLVYDKAWHRQWGGEASDWLEIVPAQRFYVVGPPQLPAEPSITSGFVGSTGVYSVSVYNQTARAWTVAVTLPDGERVCRLAPGAGDVWSWPQSGPLNGLGDVRVW